MLTKKIKTWRTWIIAGAAALVPAVAFASTHLGSHTGCSCPICSLMH